MINSILQFQQEGVKRLTDIFRTYSDDLSKLAEMIAETDFGDAKLKIYIFSPERYAFDDEFYEVQDKVQLVALPAAIYDAYQKVLPKRKEKLFEEEKQETETKFPTDLFEGQGE